MCACSRTILSLYLNCVWGLFSVLLSQCLQLYAPSIPWSSVDSCVKGDVGHQLMHTNAAMTRALNPAHTHVPWVTFNGVKHQWHATYFDA